jgi:hypothetical protein
MYGHTNTNLTVPGFFFISFVIAWMRLERHVRNKREEADKRL